MDALSAALGEGFTPEMRSAWAKVYGVLAATMQAVETKSRRASRGRMSWKIFANSRVESRLPSAWPVNSDPLLMISPGENFTHE